MKTLSLSKKKNQKKKNGLFPTSKRFSPFQAQIETQTKNLSLCSEMLGEFFENYFLFFLFFLI